MNGNIIFISGIHGVGKTTFCKYIAKKYGIEHYSASEIISKAKNYQFTTLFVDSIDDNQNILIKATKKLFDATKEYVLDGHFCLLNQFKSVEKISKKTFELLGIKQIIVLVEEIEVIHNRLKNRTGVEYNLDMLMRLQKDELQYSREISKILNVPYMVLDISIMDEILLNEKLDSFFIKNL